MNYRDASNLTNLEFSSRSIVCVYTQNDEPFYRELKIYLSLWQREGYIQWLETLGGDEMTPRMQTHLRQADLILLLISPDFFAQDHCYHAMKASFEERARRQIPVVPVLARTSSWQGSIFDNLVKLPGNEQPIAEWVHPEQAYEDIRSGLVRLMPGDANFRQRLMQETARSGTNIILPRQHGTIVQSSTMNIASVASNNGHIGNVYGGYPQQGQQYSQSSMGIEQVVSNQGHIGDIYGGVQHHIYYNAPPVDPFVRKTLLERVRKAWIKGILEPSLKNATFIPLALYERPDLIEKPWQNILQEAQQSEGPLPPDTSIADVYDESEGMLLILGEPGSGKTTLLLQLAHTLLERASRDPTHPMPVVFNLSTWTLKRQPLADWLAEELNTRYGMPRNMGKEWIAKGQLLLLLDGLDEVAADHRSACVAAINTYRQQRGHIPIIIGSRVAEYTAQPAKLAVRRAVITQQLSVQQIHEYLEKSKGHFEAIQELLLVDPGFLEFARNPLMLSILKQTYQGKTVQLARSNSIEERRRQIFADYVERMLQRRGRALRYSSEQTKYWLIWLAKQMRQQKQTVFYIEGLQLNWLEKSRSTEISTSLAFGLLTFPVAFTVFALEYTVNGTEFALVNGAIAGLMGAIIAFFYVWLLETGFRVGNLFSRAKGEKAVRKVAVKSEPRSKLAGFFTPLFWERAVFALLSGIVMGLLVELLVGPLYAMINGLFIAAFLVVLGKFERRIRPAEKMVWTWKSLRRHAVVSLLVGISIGVLGGLFDAAPYFPQRSVFLTTLYFWLSIGAALGIIIMLMRGFTSSELDKRQKDIKPNQGIRNSLSNSLRLGLFTGILLGAVVFFFYSYVMHNVFRVGYINEIPANSDVIYGVGDAVAVAYLFWLINGGFATVQHLMLRIRLWQTGRIPWRYPRFLEYAYERILLRRVGGGYMFVHKLLLDYFANLDMIEGAYKITEESKQFDPVPPAVEIPGNTQQEISKEPTAPLILIPIVSDVPRMLPCGHQQRDLNARFCSVCGRPVPPKTLEQ